MHRKTEQDTAARISTVLQKKRRQNARRRTLAGALRIASVLGLAVLLGVALYRYRDELSLEKFRQTLLITEEYGGLARLSHLSDSTARYTPVGDGLAVATTEGVQYAPRGGQGFRVDVSLAKPGMTGGGQMFLAFDRGGTALVSARAKGLLAKGEAGGTILTAYQNETGFSAVIWEEPGYNSVVAAYDKSLKRIYLWRTPAYYALAAAVSEDGKSLAVAVVSEGAQGRIDGQVLFFSLEKEGVARAVSLDGALPAAVLASQGGFTALTDRGVWQFTQTGEETGAFLLEKGEELHGFAGGGVSLYLWLDNAKGVSKYSVVHLKEGELAGRLETNRDIQAIAAQQNTLALLIGGDVHLYVHMRPEKTVSSRTGALRVFLLTDGTPVLMTGQEVYIPK